jgi:hypothetical protein
MIDFTPAIRQKEKVMRIHTPADFRNLVGQQFIAFRGRRATALELAAVRPEVAAPHQQQFTLLFTGSPGLDAGNYEIDNAFAGRLPIFMEPAGCGPASGGGALYRAEFSAPA